MLVVHVPPASTIQPLGWKEEFSQRPFTAPPAGPEKVCNIAFLVNKTKRQSIKVLLLVHAIIDAKNGNLVTEFPEQNFHEIIKLRFTHFQRKNLPGHFFLDPVPGLAWGEGWGKV